MNCNLNPVWRKPLRSEIKCRVVKWKWGLFSTDLHTSTSCQHHGGIFSKVGLNWRVSGCSGFNKRNSLFPLSISIRVSDEFKTQGNRTWPSSKSWVLWTFLGEFPRGGKGGTASLPANGDVGKEQSALLKVGATRMSCWMKGKSEMLNQHHGYDVVLHEGFVCFHLKVESHDNSQ